MAGQETGVPFGTRTIFVDARPLYWSDGDGANALMGRGARRRAERISDALSWRC